MSLFHHMYTSNSRIQRHLKRIHTTDRPSINEGPTIAVKRFVAQTYQTSASNTTACSVVCIA